MHPVIPYVTAALLFGTGVYGVLRRRNAVLLLMAVELMLNAVNVVLVTADATVRAGLLAAGAATPAVGQVFALFVIVVAAAEVGVGLAVVLQLYRLRATVALDTVPLAAPDGTVPLAAPDGTVPLAAPDDAAPLATAGDAVPLAGGDAASPGEAVSSGVTESGKAGEAG